MKTKLNIFIFTTIFILASSCVGQSGDGTRKSSSAQSSSSSTSSGGQVASSVRPDKAVSVNETVCACKDSNPDSLGATCSSICSTKSETTESVLYGTVTLSQEITGNSQLKNLKGWCENELLGSDYKNPSCMLEVFSSSFGTEYLPITVNSDNFEANVEALAYDTMYMAKIVEKGSGSNVSSNSFQIYRHNPDSSTSGNFLSVSPVNMYTCISRSVKTTNNGYSYHNWAKTHYLFRDNSQPDPLPAGTKSTICHDPGNNNADDSFEFPRLELVRTHLHFWNDQDLRFSDLDNNGVADVNRSIAEEYYQESGKQLSTEVFSLITWPNMPNISSGSSAKPNLGMYMKPYIHKNTNKASCPTQEDYRGSDSYFNVLKRFVGVDTEAVYMAESESQTDSVTSASVKDVMLISETQLKKIWYYYENNKYKVPNDNNVSAKTVKFNWPPNESSPYALNTSYQVRYTVKYPSSINSSNSSGLSTSVTPHDKRFGCIPVSID